MVHAIIMIKTDAGTSEAVVSEIRALGDVAEAHIVAGEFDVIAEVDVGEVYEVLETVSGEIQGVASVDDTRTYISLEG